MERALTKTNGVPLNVLLRCLFERNHYSKPEDRWTDTRIQSHVAHEFSDFPSMCSRYSSYRNYVPMWRGQFNRGELHRSCIHPRTFLAFRVLWDGKFVITRSLKYPMTVTELRYEYEKYNLPIPISVLKEVEGY